MQSRCRMMIDCDASVREIDLALASKLIAFVFSYKKTGAGKSVPVFL